MTITLAYHHGDACMAVRLLRWIWFLSCQNNYSMEKETILLVPSRGVAARSIHRHIAWIASQCFGEYYVKVPNGENELGWPAAPNYMFRTALEEIELRFMDDMFWIEADAVPLSPDWFDRIKEGWQEARASAKSFLGAMVPHYVDHMSGVGVYGQEWRRLAPKLVQAPNEQAWDTWAADQVMPHLQKTDLIQHIFYNPIVRSLKILHKNAKVFHQDKRGNVIALIDREVYDGQVDEDPTFNYSRIKPEANMRKCYEADNANRAIKSQGMTFPFQNYDLVAGSWRAVYVTEDAAEIAALDALASDPRNAISEITEPDFEAKSKKKLKPLLFSSDWNPQLAPQAAIRGKGAEVVEGGKAAEPFALPTQLSSIEDALVIDTVQPSQAEQGLAKKRISVQKPKRTPPSP